MARLFFCVVRQTSFCRGRRNPKFWLNHRLLLRSITGRQEPPKSMTAGRPRRGGGTRSRLIFFIPPGSFCAGRRCSPRLCYPDPANAGGDPARQSSRLRRLIDVPCDACLRSASVCSTVRESSFCSPASVAWEISLHPRATEAAPIPAGHSCRGARSRLTG